MGVTFISVCICVKSFSVIILDSLLLLLAIDCRNELVASLRERERKAAFFYLHLSVDGSKVAQSPCFLFKFKHQRAKRNRHFLCFVNRTDLDGWINLDQLDSRDQQWASSKMYRKEKIQQSKFIRASWRERRKILQVIARSRECPSRQR